MSRDLWTAVAVTVAYFFGGEGGGGCGELKKKGKGNSHMSRDGFYGIDQSATSAQGPEYTIRARPWMESVPGPLKRGQEKCSCPLLSGPGTNQERLFARFFLEMARPSFELAFIL